MTALLGALGWPLVQRAAVPIVVVPVAAAASAALPPPASVAPPATWSVSTEQVVHFSVMLVLGLIWAAAVGGALLMAWRFSTAETGVVVGRSMAAKSPLVLQACVSLGCGLLLYLFVFVLVCSRGQCHLAATCATVCVQPGSVTRVTHTA